VSRGRNCRNCLILLCVCGAVTTGCHTMRFELTNIPADHVVHEQKSFFLWGLVPTRVVNVSEKCPNGAAAVMEETRFVDGLGDFFTLGIWTPRSSTYYCRPAPPLALPPTPTPGPVPGSTP